MLNRRARINVLSGMLLSLVAVACAGLPFTNGPIDGQVLDYDSGKPIVGAIVVARWEGTQFMVVQSESVCVHAETTTSDAEGRFHFNVWAAPSTALGVQPTVDAYKEGYWNVGRPLQYAKNIDRLGHSDGTWVVFSRGRPYEVLLSFPDEDSARDATHPANLYLKTFTGSPSERFEYLSRVVYIGMGCYGASANNQGLYPLYKAAFREAMPLATTAQQKKRLANMQQIAVSVWLGPGSSRDIGRLAIPSEIKGDLE